MAISWVVKVTKFCNLRCSYCYEWNELSDSRQMQLDVWRKLILEAKKVHEAKENAIHKPLKTFFVWHGGEPTVLPISYFKSVIELQEEILGAENFSSGKYQNLIQTNLYSYNEDKISYLVESGFGIGVSYDHAPGVRLTINGNQTEERVRSNLLSLKRKNGSLGAIVVLAKHTCADILNVYSFFAENEISIRALALKSGPNERPADNFILSEKEITEALCALFDENFKRGMPIRIDPLSGYFESILLKMCGLKSKIFDRRLDGDSVIIVNTGGDLYMRRDAYEPEKSFGIIGDINGSFLSNGAYLQSLETDDNLRKRFCLNCNHMGSCTTTPILEDNIDRTERHCAIAKEVMDHIESTLVRQGLTKRLLHNICIEGYLKKWQKQKYYASTLI